MFHIALGLNSHILGWRKVTRPPLLVFSKTKVFYFSEFLEHSLFSLYCPWSYSNGVLKTGSLVHDCYDSFSPSLCPLCSVWGAGLGFV